MQNQDQSYSSAIKELETILAKMESDQCDIDTLSSQTARALELLKFCKERLLKVDKEVEKCISALTASLE